MRSAKKSTPASKSKADEFLTRYDALNAQYADMPPKVREKLIQSELYGNAFELRMSDIVPNNSVRALLNGQLYELLQTELAALGPEYTAIQFFEVLMRFPQLPMSYRRDAAKFLAPYKHSKMPVRVEQFVPPPGVSTEEYLEARKQILKEMGE